MSLAMLVGVAVGGTSLSATIILVLRYFIRHEMADVKAESTPNGGNSMNDFIKLQIYPLLCEVRGTQIAIVADVSTLKGQFDEHTRSHK